MHGDIYIYTWEVHGWSLRPQIFNLKIISNHFQTHPKLILVRIYTSLDTQTSINGK